MNAMSRRNFCIGAGSIVGLLGLGGSLRYTADAWADDGIVFPPGGQDPDRLEALCLRCGKCRSACPEICITDTKLEEMVFGARVPSMNFRRGYCTFCDKCIEVCPTGALLPFDPESDKMGIAVINKEECLAYTMGDCDICVDACDYQAIILDDSFRPVVDDSLCNGCGRCEYVCPSAKLRSYSGTGQRGIEVVGVQS